MDAAMARGPSARGERTCQPPADVSSHASAEPFDGCRRHACGAPRVFSRARRRRSGGPRLRGCPRPRSGNSVTRIRSSASTTARSTPSSSSSEARARLSEARPRRRWRDGPAAPEPGVAARGPRGDRPQVGQASSPCSRPRCDPWSDGTDHVNGRPGRAAVSRTSRIACSRRAANDSLSSRNAATAARPSTTV